MYVYMIYGENELTAKQEGCGRLDRNVVSLPLSYHPLCLFTGGHGRKIGGNTKKRAIRTCEWGQTHLCNPLPKMAFQDLSLLLLIWSGLWRKKKKKRRKGEKGRCDGDALLPTSFDRHMLFLPLVSLHLLVHIEYSNACCSHMLWMHMDVHGF
ncbi:unnamed protein product [Musa acuminata subsp. burmannicoides]